MAVRAAWLTDIHLEFLGDDAVARFLDEVKATEPDCILIGGDTGQAHSVCGYLTRLEAALLCPVYFVLGNHDYYRGSIRGVRQAVGDVARASRHLRWLSASGVVELAEETCLIGHDGWGDARFGDFHGSEVLLSDFFAIEELTGLSREVLRTRLNQLGDEAAEHLQPVLRDALNSYRHVVVLTHVPPFIEAAWYEGRYCDADWLPFFACKAAGDILRRAMSSVTGQRLTVLCGHTHGGGTSHVTPNIVSHTGPAEYGYPVIQRVFEWA